MAINIIIIRGIENVGQGELAPARDLSIGRLRRCSCCTITIATGVSAGSSHANPAGVTESGFPGDVASPLFGVSDATIGAFATIRLI